MAVAVALFSGVRNETPEGRFLNREFLDASMSSFPAALGLH